MANLRDLLLVGALLVVVAASASCRGRPTSRSAADSTALPAGGEAQSPAMVARSLREHFASRDYAAIAPLLAPDCRQRTLELLVGVAEVLSANERLKTTAEAAYAGPMTETWDLAAMENNLGVFSARATLISETFKGDRATVTLQEADAIPLIHAEFELHDGRWLHRPEPAPTRMASELRRLAEVIDQITESVRRGSTFETYVNAFFDRVIPQMRRIVTVQDESAELVVGPPAD